MWGLIGAAALELLADKVPVVDHLMHVLYVVLKPTAAAIVVGGTTHPHSNEELIFLIAIGALNAFGIHGAVAGVRAASTAVTGGLGTPVLSTVEDSVSVGGIVLAFLAPVIAAVMALIFTVVLLLVAKRIYRRIRRPRTVRTG